MGNEGKLEVTCLNLVVIVRVRHWTRSEERGGRRGEKKEKGGPMKNKNSQKLRKSGRSNSL